MICYAITEYCAISKPIKQEMQIMLDKETILDKMSQVGTSICRLPDSPNWGLFSEPIDTLVAYDLDSVPSIIAIVEQQLSKGLYCAGFLSYESAPAFDPAYRVKTSEGFPLCWFAVYDKAPVVIDFSAHDYTIPHNFLRPNISQEHYNQSIETILAYIGEGDIYQANNTIRAFGARIESPEQLFLSLVDSHPVPYSCYVNTGNEKIVSISPELFLQKNGNDICSFPMKGTASRNPEKKIDDIVAQELAKDEKNCAENVMIVDMVRNDFGRICQPGSIYVDPLFQVDTYQTLHQMISKVHGTLSEDTSLFTILSGTFPASSITGAPKIRAMEVIEELECSPRNVYTGSMGCFMPNGDFCLNVAIRTLICSSDKTELGIGSGIVADSTSHSEWNECLLKSEFASHKPVSFQILETFLYTSENGLELRELHLERAKRSQEYFGRLYSEVTVSESLTSALSDLSCKQARVRLLIDKDGNATTEYSEIKQLGWFKNQLSICVSDHAVDSNDIFLYHKTTNRQFYNDGFAEAVNHDFDEVIFVNERQEVTEGAISNIFALIKGRWFTPPISSGLLAGTWRESTLKTLNAMEKVLTIQDLTDADQVIIGNSVRGQATVGQITIGCA